MNKNKLILGLIILSLFFINIVPVLAQSVIDEWLRFLFLDMSALAQSGDQIFIIYFKILLFFLVFSVIFWSAEKVFHEKKPIAVTVSFVVSIVSIMLLPGEIILFIFNTYSAIIGYVFVLLPLVAGGILAQKLGSEWKWHPHVERLVKGLIFIGIALLTFSLSTTLLSYDFELYYDVAKWAKVGGWFCIIVGVYYIISMGRKDQGHGGGEGGGH